MAEEVTGSWSSAKFRKMLLIESIASIFSKDSSSPALPPLGFEDHQRNKSTSTEGSAVNAVGSRDISQDEKAHGITPVNSAVSSSGDSKKKRWSDGSGERMPRSGDLTNLRADPMTSHTEGGINYRSLLWWYVVSSF